MRRRRRFFLPTVHRPLTTDHNGFTLVELLVVIAIISAITIATIPLIVPALDTRRIREASRMFTTQLAEAQANAIATGRPAGIWMQRLNATNPDPAADRSAAMDIFLCEIPQPYAGDSLTSRATVRVDNSVANFPRYYLEFADTSWISLPLRPGDLIRFNYRGPWYRLTGDTAEYTNQLLQIDGTIGDTVQTDKQGKYIKPPGSATPYKLAFDRIRTNPQITGGSYNASDYQSVAMPPNNATFPYQIYRQPVKSSAPPMQLPGRSAIDLYFSGGGPIGSSGYFGGISGFSTDALPIVITFGRTGALDSIYIGGTQYTAADPIYLLIGKREKLPAQAYSKSDDVDTQASKHNFRDTENIWVTINPKTGLVSTTEVAQFDDTAITAAPPLPTAIGLSRQFATSAQSMGGR